jgi:hypothetical protein
MEISRPAVMILCLAAGFGATVALRTDETGKRTEVKAAETATASGASLSSRGRKLHLEHLWSRRRATFDAREAEPRVLAAIAADRWDDAAKNELVSLLIASPSSINTIWNQTDPGTRNQMMAKVIKAVIEANPSTALAVLDEGRFDFSKIPGAGDLLNQALYYGRSRIDAFDAAQRNREKLGERQLSEMMWGMGRYADIARLLLKDAALGGVYPKRELENACEALLRHDGGLPPGTETLEAAKASLARKAAQDQTTAWLGEGKPLTTDALRTMDDKGFSESFFEQLWDYGKIPAASQLELLAAAGRGEAQQRALEIMIEAGRSKDALRLLQELKDMPATKPHRSGLITAVANAIYQEGGDVGEACRLLEGITDDPAYWKSMTEVLQTWVIDDPVAGRTYLQQVKDPELRRSLEEALAKASLDP